ncbi:HK97 family phage prohead protease [Salinicoccus roseus]|uniref:Primosome assembly protein PriA n=1 Tax=Salinicoccus roseus TaxID=45670 RepID=A0A265E690_9STAP|nr:HK97 family phage prohead protease [Salinicoccus roseus]OZT77117.1 primosome assembly protein PriA [Salinicoccus roseus]
MGNKTKVKREKQFRHMEVRLADDVQDDDKLIVEGYAVRFNDPAVLYTDELGNEYKEVIARGALDGADLSDVPFKYNHSNETMIMARTRNNTLQLTIDEFGLFIRAELADTSTGRDLYTLIKRGDIDKMSFAFTVLEDTYDRDNRTRTINKIDKLFDVAAVDFPAYESTSISARSFFELEREKEEALERAAEEERQLEKQRRQKLNLKLKLGGIEHE